MTFFFSTIGSTSRLSSAGNLQDDNKVMKLQQRINKEIDINEYRYPEEN
jgi:hypothetical protein